MAQLDSKSQGPRVLRIGIVQNGRIVEERVVPAKSTVSVGSSERNDFVFAAEGLPSRFELFQFANGEYVLNFTDAMKGRLVVPIGQGELGDLRASGHARDAGGYKQIKLDDTSRGRLDLGGTSVVFQFVDAPRAIVRPPLPDTMLGGLGGNVDWTFTSFVTGSFLFFFASGLYLSTIDPVVESGLRTLPDELAHLVIDEPPPPEVEQETPQNTDEGPSEEAPQERPSEASNDAPSSSDTRDVANNAEAQASLANDVANQVMANMLGSLQGDAATGIMRDLLQGSAVTDNIGDQIATAGGTAAPGSGTHGLHEAGGNGGSGTGGSLGTLQGGSGPRTTGETGGGQQPEVQVRRPTVRGSGGGVVGGAGTFDQGQVASRVRSLSASINRCYEQQLATNPTLEGRVTVGFTITEQGSVTSPQVDAPNAALASCVSAVIGRLRFNPPPVGGSVRIGGITFVFNPG